jgi:Protein of unknown function (DUF3618)
LCGKRKQRCPLTAVNREIGARIGALKMSDASDEDRTIRQLEREAERNRAELVNTVEELRERVSPAQVKEDVKQYASQTGQHFVVNLVDKARENPLQAAAVAALVGYPVWQLVRSIPVPVMLLGAGALLAGRLAGSGSSQSSSGSAWQSGQSGYGSSYGGQSGYGFEGARSGYATAYGQSDYGYGSARSSAGYGDGTSGQNYESGRSSSDYAGQSGYGYEGDWGSSGYRQGRSGYGSGYEGEAYSSQSDGIQAVIERNPMLVTGLGLLVGALLGGSLAASGALPHIRQDSY